MINISTFQDDLFDLKGFASRLEKFIDAEHAYIEGGLVISLSSKYGSGKTTFFNMWKESIESEGDKFERPLVISLNAWESDYYGDPLFAIIFALISRMHEKGKIVRGLENAAKNFGLFATAIGSQIVKKFTGIDAIAAGEFSEKKKTKLEREKKIIPDSFSIYQARKTAMDSLKNEIVKLVSSNEPKVLFLVDELDRCRPDYAITYLETIKHIFDIKGCVFILAADRDQLENSAKTAFGRDLDFEEYYRKFIHREITLPRISDAGYKKLAYKYVPYYLERAGERHCFMRLAESDIGLIPELIGALKLTPRQIQEVFRIIGHSLSTSEEKKGLLNRCLGFGTIAMATFKVGDYKIYHLLGKGQIECEEFVKYLKSLLKKDAVEWWFLLFLTGGGLKRKEDENDLELIKRAGFTAEDGEISINGNLGHWRSGWGFSHYRRISEIYENIEQISLWN